MSLKVLWNDAVGIEVKLYTLVYSQTSGNLDDVYQCTMFLQADLLS